MASFASANGARARHGRSQSPSHRRRSADLIFGAPAQLMVPRIVFLLAAVLLTAFGLMMIYSASSVTAMLSKDSSYSPTYYFIKQLIFVGMGAVVGAIIYRLGYRILRGMPIKVLTGLVIMLLIATLTPIAGHDAYGASRWIRLPGMTLQPSEFAKLTVIVSFAFMWSEYAAGERDARDALILVGASIVVPLLLILRQPDKGTTTVLAVTLFVMMYFGGFPKKLLLLLVMAGIAGFVALSLKDDYSRQRVMTMLNPWDDPNGAGYQLIQGFYALGAGGLFGVGIGMGKQKYSYLPMAYNDFIFAVVGEELGLVGAVGMLLGFAVLFWAGMQIARNAPDLAGQLIAMGCTTMLVAQMFLNVTGVLGMFPLSGKPIPFISYGGSSILSTLMVVGLVLGVSRESSLPQTEYEERRRGWSVSGSELGEDSGVGVARPRSARTAQGGASSFTVLGGGRSAAGGTGRDAMPRGRVSRDAQGRQRIDLGPSAGDRLRSRQGGGPQVRGTSGSHRRGGSRGR